MIELFKIRVDFYTKHGVKFINVDRSGLGESTNPRGMKIRTSLDRRLNYSEESTPKADAKLSGAALKQYTKVLGSNLQYYSTPNH